MWFHHGDVYTKNVTKICRYESAKVKLGVTMRARHPLKIVGGQSTNSGPMSTNGNMSFVHYPIVKLLKRESKRSLEGHKRCSFFSLQDCRRSLHAFLLVNMLTIPKKNCLNNL